MQSLLLWGEVRGGQSSASPCDWWADKRGGRGISGREIEAGDKTKAAVLFAIWNTCAHYLRRCKQRKEARVYALNGYASKSVEIRSQACKWGAAGDLCVLCRISQNTTGPIKPFQCPVGDLTHVFVLDLTPVSRKQAAHCTYRKLLSPVQKETAVRIGFKMHKTKKNKKNITVS